MYIPNTGPTYRPVITYYSRIDKEWFEMSFKPRGIWCWNNWRFNFELESAGWSSSNFKREKRRFGVSCKNFIARISKKWWRRRATGHIEWLSRIHEPTKSEFNSRWFFRYLRVEGQKIIQTNEMNYFFHYSICSTNFQWAVWNLYYLRNQSFPLLPVLLPVHPKQRLL